jgi:hypothetical protein
VDRKHIGAAVEFSGILGVVLLDVCFVLDGMAFLLFGKAFIPVSTAEVLLILLVNALLVYFSGHLLHDHTPPPAQTRIEEQSQRNTMK